MWKKYVLYCYVDKMEDPENKFYFDTKEQMFNFIKNGDDDYKPEDIKVAAMFEMKQIYM